VRTWGNKGGKKQTKVQGKTCFFREGGGSPPPKKEKKKMVYVPTQAEKHLSEKKSPSTFNQARETLQKTKRKKEVKPVNVATSRGHGYARQTNAAYKNPRKGAPAKGEQRKKKKEGGNEWGGEGKHFGKNKNKKYGSRLGKGKNVQPIEKN